MKSPIRPSPADEERLIKAGFSPVIRWVEGISNDALKTVEALTLLDRREEAQKKPTANGVKKKR